MTEASLEIWDLLNKEFPSHIAWKIYKDVNVMPHLMKWKLTWDRDKMPWSRRIMLYRRYRFHETFDTLHATFNPGWLADGFNQYNCDPFFRPCRLLFGPEERVSAGYRHDLFCTTNRHLLMLYKNEGLFDNLLKSIKTKQ